MDPQNPYKAPTTNVNFVEVETELPEVMITSEAKLIDYNVDADRGGMLSVKYSRTDNHKCGRCWRYLSEVTSDGELCARCDGVVNG